VTYPSKKSSHPGVRLAAVALVALLMLFAGCGRSRQAEQVRNLRLAGQPDSARAIALAALLETPNHNDLWLEFARSTVEVVRLRPEEENHSDDRDLLVQASLVCAARYQHDKHEPSRDWRDTGKMLSAELARQVNEIITTMTSQTQQATYLRPLLTSGGPDSLIPQGPQIQAQQTMAEYRMSARRVFYWSVVLRRLLESLPEVNPGTASLLASQLDEGMAVWTQALDLDPSYINTVQLRARQEIDQALNHASQDLNDLGYFLPQTIIENGVSQ
jgi:hypothetical protein